MLAENDADAAPVAAVVAAFVVDARDDAESVEKDAMIRVGHVVARAGDAPIEREDSIDYFEITKKTERRKGSLSLDPRIED